MLSKRQKAAQKLGEFIAYSLIALFLIAAASISYAIMKCAFGL